MTFVQSLFLSFFPPHPQHTLEPRGKLLIVPSVILGFSYLPQMHLGKVPSLSFASVTQFERALVFARTLAFHRLARAPQTGQSEHLYDASLLAQSIH